jgi:uncharacterized low-complexity protein
MSDTGMPVLPATLIGIVIAVLTSQPASADRTANPFRSSTDSVGPVLTAQGNCGGGMMGRRGKCGMQRMDANNDGKVTKDEFMKGHEDMFSRIDKNADGVIDIEERNAHRQMMRSRMGRCGPGKCGQGDAE